MSYFTEDQINRAVVYSQSKLRKITSENNEKQTVLMLPLTFVAHAAGQADNEQTLARFSSILKDSSHTEREHACHMLFSACKSYQVPIIHDLLREIFTHYVCLFCISNTIDTHGTQYSEEFREVVCGYNLIQLLQKSLLEARMQTVSA